MIRDEGIAERVDVDEPECREERAAEEHYRDGRPAADAVADDGLDPGATLFNGACVYALAAESARRDGSLSPQARVVRAERYAAHAVELLQRAHTAGFFRDPNALEALEAHQDLDPVRARTDFRSLCFDLAFPTDPFVR